MLAREGAAIWMNVDAHADHVSIRQVVALPHVAAALLDRFGHQTGRRWPFDRDRVPFQRGERSTV